MATTTTRFRRDRKSSLNTVIKWRIRADLVAPNARGVKACRLTPRTDYPCETAITVLLRNGVICGPLGVTSARHLARHLVPISCNGALLGWS
jgi:hypothetical protein